MNLRRFLVADAILRTSDQREIQNAFTAEDVIPADTRHAMAGQSIGTLDGDALQSIQRYHDKQMLIINE